MNISVKEFLSLLNKVQPGLSKKETLEQSTHFVFKDGRVYTFNDEVAVSVKSGFELDFEGAVPSKELLSFLNKTKEETLRIREKSGELLFIGKRTQMGLFMESTISLPVDEVKIPKTFSPIPKNFLDAVSFCLFSAGSDSATPALMCIHVAETFVETCDGFRMTRKALCSPMPIKMGLIPASSARFFSEYKIDKCAANKGWVHFKEDSGLVFSCRVEELEFPNMEPFLKVKGDKVVIPESVVDNLERCAIFSKSDHEYQRTVEITFQEGKMIIYGDGEFGWIKEKVDVDYTGPSLNFIVSPKHLKDILTTKQTVTVGDGHLKFHGEDFDHVICLFVPSEEESDAQDETAQEDD